MTNIADNHYITLDFINRESEVAECMTDTLGRMHSDAQFAGSSSVPAHVEMMGLIGMGNNPMVGASVAVAVAVSEAMNK